MARRKQPRPFRMSHPNEIIMAEIDTRWGFTCPESLTLITGFTADEIQELRENKVVVTEDLAKHLHQILGMQAEFWLKLQADYDEWKAGEP